MRISGGRKKSRQMFRIRNSVAGGFPSVENLTQTARLGYNRYVR
jgi:hypothetical protein